MKLLKNQYYIHYTGNNSPKLKKFKSKDSLKLFITKFISKHGQYSDSHWIDFWFKGNGELFDSGIEIE